MLKKFHVNVTLRILGIIALVLLLVWCIVADSDFYITMFILGALVVLSIVDMVRYVNSSNRDFTAFLLGIKYEDFSATYSGHHKGKTFGELYDAFNQINRKFLNIRAEKEANHQYLQTVVESVDVGLLCVDPNGNVFMMNKALQKILHKPYLPNLESLAQIDFHLLEVVKNLKAGERELVKVTIEQRPAQLALQATEFSLRNQPLKLVSFQNIQGELEEQELEAWQKLIRILRHEIMNSITPIVSLTATIDGMLEGTKGGIEKEQADDVKSAIAAIRKRSEGLMHFTETYRTLTRLPTPKFQLVDANDLVERLHVLFKPAFEKTGVTFQKQLSPTPVIFHADVELMEQVLINLLKNALDALKNKENPIVTVSTQRTKEGKTILQVADNGAGIEKETLGQIFVPFFTTKEDGSGIGLSLARQILRMHKGRISVQSVLGEGTVFTISL